MFRPYHARWYDPALGHFLSPDSIVPEAGNALDYHRYAYVRFNPLKYSDPSGHCPQPSGEFANLNIICVAGFIPTQTSSGLPGLVYFRGDDRDFSNASNPEASRFWLWISAESGEILASFAHPTQRAPGPLGGLSGNPSPPSKSTSCQSSSGDNSREQSIFHSKSRGQDDFVFLPCRLL